MEIFKTIREYPSYSVSNLGRIKKNSSNKIMTPSKKPDGYMQINLFTNDGRRKKEYVHRLVALTFIPNERHLPQVNHIDRVRDHNEASNLEWVDSKENVHKSSLLKPIIVRKNGEIIGEYDYIGQAIEELNLTSSNVSACLNEKRQKTHKGYTFEFAKT